ncbi:pyridoxamine 5'-phosphate oxidase family protein [Eubacterium sp. MSJ-13]|uniref:pyridoxamine 5'-phosphate oxidase family protein n=1 Tax=Eubacterium sp. MSJ-13 TaxID=2841513 RepID=UPI001C115B03|nr:pyridoxamine 5'-phosphate oxidase family protein [Eubacterium sp. MSJ-13]MBU5479104.1 pyridoxamine 5'-phosphate oxidase family protein [Eubacterium sp. MSJ-13]
MRRKDREIKEISEVLDIVERAKVLRMGLFDGEYPYIVPLHYGYEYKDGVLIFYAHGAKEGHKIDLIHVNPNTCIELESDMEIVSGEDIPCQYGTYYASVIGRGTVELVKDVQEKIRGLNLLMKNQVGREFSITPQMAQTVQVMKVTINNFSAKSRKKTQ